MTASIPNDSVITSVVGRGIPKTQNDQNTDDIIPARFMKEITFASMGKYVYYDERFKDGKLVPTHPLNDAKYSGGIILIAGANFGCGSSREHAPQALFRYGIKAIVAESFAEIFAGNCATLGIVGVTLPATEIALLAAEITKNPSTEITINLSEKKITYNKKSAALELPEGRRQSFLNGTWDALSVLAQKKSEILSTEKKIDYLQFK